jgi:hypothetical protein
MKIYKYRALVTTEPFTLTLPKGAHILSVHTQHAQCQLWAMVDPEAGNEERSFRIVATGESFNPEGLTYIGTWHGVEGWMVFHLFEQKPA